MFYFTSYLGFYQDMDTYVNCKHGVAFFYLFKLMSMNVYWQLILPIWGQLRALPLDSMRKKIVLVICSTEHLQLQLGNMGALCAEHLSKSGPETGGIWDSSSHTDKSFDRVCKNEISLCFQVFHLSSLDSCFSLVKQCLLLNLSFQENFKDNCKEHVAQRPRKG